MKDYPRIHSLSTIGIRFHLEFDFKFHSFRTDFVGDSGWGKSMVADLLQLIFVGSDAFVSPTHSNEKREPKGMVLPSTQSRGAGMGYAFLNVEVQRGAFIVFGIYLHEIDNTVEHFTIQSGYDADGLHTIPTPLRVADLGLTSQVPSTSAFSTLIEKRELVYKHRPRKKFHRWLFDNGLLTMDLSAEKTLKDYASIIQSFSRGRTLKTASSESLKDFLFGPEKGAEILAKFRGAVTELQDATRQSEKYKADTVETGRKWRDIHFLEEAKKSRDEAEHALRTAECAYAFQQETLALARAQELIVETKNSLTNLEVYRENIGVWLQMSAAQSAELAHRSTVARLEFAAVEKEHEALQKARGLLDAIGCKPSELREIYERNRVGLDHATRLAEFLNALTQEEVLTRFQSIITPETSIAELLDGLDRLHSKADAGLESQRALLRFAQMNVAGKFGGWAIREGKALSREAESVLMYLKDLSTAPIPNPKEGDRIVTRPDILLASIDPSPDEAAGGFWLSLNGTEEFVQYREEQLFSEESIETLPAQLSALAAVSQRAIDDLEIEVAGWRKLREVLRNIPGGAKEALAAYRYFEFEGNPKPNAVLHIPETDFESYLHALEKAASISERFKIADTAAIDAANEKARFGLIAEEMQALKTQVQSVLDESRWTDQLREIEEALLPVSYYNNPSAIATQTASEASHAPNTATFYRDKISEARAAHRTSETLEAYEHHKKWVGARDHQRREYALLYGKEPAINLIERGRIDEPIQERDDYSTANTAYDVQFGHIVKLYVNDDFRFKDSQDYDELCATVLPHILGKNRPEGLSNIEAFEKYSYDIIEKNKKLNARKLQKIKELLDDVQSEVSTRMHEARNIDAFLNRKEREITGGHRVRLEQKPSRQYPLKWITDYTDLGSLFTTGSDTMESLTAAGTSLEDKMLEAFYQLGGDRATEVTIEKLLDPNSYFDLTFSIQSATNERAKGSTGQTYTAVALLCIARLSRVEQGARAGRAPGLRFMPIDEAEGLGTNYDMLHKVAKDFDYQIISMSINPLSSSPSEGRYLYDLRKNPDTDEDVNLTPMAVFEEASDEA